MFSFTIARIPSAASSAESRPIASAIVCTEARAASASSAISPPSRLGGRCPRTTFASVTVGSVPPRPYEAGPGSAPADCGPTRSAFVSSGTWAIEPPPAPTVCTLTEGTLIRKWPIEVSRPIVGSPSLAERDIGRGAAHVEGEDVLEAGFARDVERAGDAPRGPREDPVDRVPHRLDGRHQARRRSGGC